MHDLGLILLTVGVSGLVFSAMSYAKGWQEGNEAGWHDGFNVSQGIHTALEEGRGGD